MADKVPSVHPRGCCAIKPSHGCTCFSANVKLDKLQMGAENCVWPRQQSPVVSDEHTSYALLHKYEFIGIQYRPPKVGQRFINLALASPQ